MIDILTKLSDFPQIFQKNENYLEKLPFFIWSK